MDCRECINTNCFINGYCLPNWIGYIQYNKTIKSLAANRSIFSRGDLVEGIYVMCSGKAKIVMRTYNERQKEKEQIIRVAGNGQIMGHRGLSEEMIYPISAETIAESEIAYISNTDFIKLINSNKDFAYHLMMFFADELLRSEQIQRAFDIYSINQKVSFALLSIASSFGYKNDTKGELDLCMNLKDLANFASVSMQSLNKVFDRLTDKNILEVVDEKVFLFNESGLLDYARFNYTG